MRSTPQSKDSSSYTKSLPAAPAAPTHNVSRRYVISLAFLSACIVLALRSPQHQQQIATSQLDSRTKVVVEKPIRQISILGERNSGTRWTYE
jgi:hypothetical protein